MRLKFCARVLVVGLVLLGCDEELTSRDAATDPMDSGADSGAADSAVEDSAVEDSGAADSGAADSAVEDSGAADSGAADSGAADSGTADSGTADSGTADSGALTCTPVEPLRCDATTLETCNADGDGVVRTECADGCNGTRLECNECAPSMDYCVDTMTIATCDADGTMPSTDRSCVYGCNADRIECNACVPSTTQCHGNTRVICSAVGEIESEMTCPVGCAVGVCSSPPPIDAGPFPPG